MATTNGIPDDTPPDKRPRGGYSAPPPDESPHKSATADPSKEYVASTGYGAGLRDYLRALPVYVDDLTREVDLHVYERMRWDECVAGSLDALVYQALADDIDFRPAVDDEDSQYYDDSKTQADTMNRVMADLERPLIEWAYEMVSDAIGGGNRVSEKVVRQEEGGPYSGLWVWDRLKVKPRRHLSFAMDTFNNLRGILTAIPGQYMGLDGSIPVDPKKTPNLLPREKFALLSWNSHNDDPRGRPLLRRVYVPWWEKIQVAGEWLKHLSRFGSPSVVGTTAPNSDFVPPQDEFGNALAGTAPGPEQALLNGLERLQNGGCLVLPYGATVTALQVAQSGSAFLTKVDQCDRAISRGVLLAIRAVMEAQHGSKADSQTAQDVTGLVVRYVKNWAARMITRDLVKPLVVWNKGADAARVICPYASLTPVEHQDWSQKATAVAALKTSGFLKPSQEPALAEEMGLPPATEPVEQPQPQPGQQPGQNGAEVNSAADESAATFAADSAVDLSDLDLSNLDRGEVLSLFVDAALHAQGEDGQSALFYDPNQLRDHSGRWTSGGGSGGMVHADRQVQRQTAQEHVRAFVRRTGPVQQKEAEELAVQLAGLTVEQLHGLKKEHGLKASAPNKAALVAKLAERFQQARSGQPGERVKGADPYAITKEKDKWLGSVYQVGERSFAKKEEAAAHVNDLKQRGLGPVRTDTPLFTLHTDSFDSQYKIVKAPEVRSPGGVLRPSGYLVVEQPVGQASDRWDRAHSGNYPTPEDTLSAFLGELRRGGFAWDAMKPLEPGMAQTLKLQAEKEASEVKAAKEASDRAAEQKAAQEKRWRDYHAHWSEKAKELKGVKREIAVSTGTGKQAGIPATVYGGLAVHKRQNAPGIAITHEHTGLLVGGARSLADAKVMTAALLGAGIDWSFWRENDAAPDDMKRAARIIRGFYAKIPPDDFAPFGEGAEAPFAGPPDEERDESGKWTAGGSAAEGVSPSGAHALAKALALKPHTVPQAIKATGLTRAQVARQLAVWDDQGRLEFGSSKGGQMTYRLKATVPLPQPVEPATPAALTIHDLHTVVHDMQEREHMPGRLDQVFEKLKAKFPALTIEEFKRVALAAHVEGERLRLSTAPGAVGNYPALDRLSLTSHEVTGDPQGIRRYGFLTSQREPATTSAPSGAPFAEENPFDFSDISLGGLSREEIAEILIDAALDARDDAEFAWDESKHPRGQPENKGQFGPGGGGAAPHEHFSDAGAAEHNRQIEELQKRRDWQGARQLQRNDRLQAVAAYHALPGPEIVGQNSLLDQAKGLEPIRAKPLPDGRFAVFDGDIALPRSEAWLREHLGGAIPGHDPDAQERLQEQDAQRRELSADLRQHFPTDKEALERTFYAPDLSLNDHLSLEGKREAVGNVLTAAGAGFWTAKEGADLPQVMRSVQRDITGERPRKLSHPDSLEHLYRTLDSPEQRYHLYDREHSGADTKAVHDAYQPVGKRLNEHWTVLYDPHKGEGGFRLIPTATVEAKDSRARQRYHFPSREEAAFDSAEFYDPSQIRDHRGRWATGGGSGGAALPHAERQAQRESAKETVRRFMAGKGSPSLQEASGLAQALSTLTVAQLHEVKKEHGLKASSPDKAGLVKKLAERFRAAREAKPAEPKPSEKKPAESKASDLRRETVKSAIGDTYSPYNGTHQLLQDIAGKHDTLAGALAEAERQGLIDTRQRSPQTDVSPLQRDRQGEWVRRVLGEAYGEKEAEAKPGERFLEGRPIGERIAAYKGGEVILQAFADHAARNARMVKAFEETGQHWQETVDAYQQTLVGQDQAYRDGDEAAVNRLTKDLRRLEKERTAAERAYDDARTQFDDNRDNGKKLLLEQLKPATAQKVEIQPHPDLPRRQIEEGNKAAVFLRAVLNRVPQDPELQAVIHAPVAPGNYLDRAHYQGTAHEVDWPTMRTSEHDWDNVSVHELGHHVENELPGVQDAAREFLAHRVGSEPLTKLSEKFPDAGYRDSEVGRKDDFEKLFGKDSSHAYYVGKDYPGQKDTEIVSMGIEKLYQDPVGFAARDPEYFKFMVGILKGDLRGGQP